MAYGVTGYWGIVDKLLNQVPLAACQPVRNGSGCSAVARAGKLPVAPGAKKKAPDARCSESGALAFVAREKVYKPPPAPRPGGLKKYQKQIAKLAFMSSIFASGRGKCKGGFAPFDYNGLMEVDKPQFQFRLRDLLITVSIAALIFAGTRVDPCLGTTAAYATLLVAIMGRYRWSDIAMSVCTILFVVGLIVLGYFVDEFRH